MYIFKSSIVELQISTFSAASFLTWSDYARFWFKILVGMFLVIAVNSLVICGVSFSLNMLLLPWQIFYSIGKQENILGTP